MKSIILSSAAVALLFFGGCADKKPQAQSEEMGSKSVEEVAPVHSDTISSGSSSMDSSGGALGSKSISDVEAEMATIYFDFDKFNIRSDMQDDLSRDASIAKSEAAEYTVKLEGNCDEWGSDEYNFALGLKRANSVKNAMVAEGVGAERITLVTYGESSPVCTEKTKECWSKNRRVDFKLLP